MEAYKKEYLKWTTDELFDDNTKKELLSIKDEKEIEDRFYKQLSFGTGGLRGIIGAGTNRMNYYTVGKATQGLANFINSKVSNGSVAIAYDSRRMSKEFALDSALILAGNGIKAYLFEDLRPTPELSFAINQLKTTSGIVITASHNPPEYNGYKVYWSDGAQVVAPYDKLIIQEVNNVTDYRDVKRISKEQATEKGLLEIIGKEIDDLYIAQLKKQVLNPEVIKRMAKDIKIVYSPFCGTGKMPVLRMLKELGFENVWTVKEQIEPNGDFPTLEYPNPEDPNAFKLALKLANEVGADIVMATDPDADRLGIYALDKATGEYLPFTGNMSGLLIAEYVLSQKREKGLLPKNAKDGALITTIVSSNMAHAIANEYGLTVFEVLTGFKYIGEKIKEFLKATEENGGKLDASKGAFEYLFGYEESYGCLVGTHARDKDAIMAVTCLSEAAAYYKSKGLTLVDQMQNMYEKYGYYREGMYTKVLKGLNGVKMINGIMNTLRQNPPTHIGEDKILVVKDYLTSQYRNLITGENGKIDLPVSDVLYYELENSGWCCVRPSGTEPKIKFYFGIKAEDKISADKKVEEKKKALANLTN